MKQEILEEHSKRFITRFPSPNWYKSPCCEDAIYRDGADTMRCNECRGEVLINDLFIYEMKKSQEYLSTSIDKVLDEVKKRVRDEVMSVCSRHPNYDDRCHNCTASMASIPFTDLIRILKDLKK